MRHTVSERRKRWFFVRSLFKSFWEHLDKRARRKRAVAVSRPLFAEALEARVMFSASPVPVEQEQPVDEAPVAQEAEMEEVSALAVSGPTNLRISSGTSNPVGIQENGAPRALLGYFQADHSDPKGLRYTLIDGVGANDNALFAVGTGEPILVFNGVADFETKPQYSIRVQVVDPYGNSLEKTFLIDVVDVPEVANSAPTNFELRESTPIRENNPSGKPVLVGYFNAEDVDNQKLAFSLAKGDGDRDNGSFSIIKGYVLEFNAVADFETKPQYSIRAQVSDGFGGIVMPH